MSDRPGAAEGAETTSFGFREVATADKQRLVDEVFDRVAARYDLMNDLMSAGMHRLWKDAMVAWLAPPRQATIRYRVLDLAGGTGDIATRIVRASAGASVVVGAINAKMLAEGARRAEKAGLSARLSFVEANAEELPFGKDDFDAVTIAFGIRNVPRIDKALAEIRRVLRPGGRFLCLEFSTVDIAGLDRLYDLFSFHVIPRLGGVVADDRDSYQYLVESIRRFPNQARFADMIRAAGFRRVEYRNLTGGIAAIHSGWKI